VIRHLFLSPHFDDVVGSCGGSVWRLASGGQSVRILTIFGGRELLPFSKVAQQLHRKWSVEQPVEQRRLEDESACHTLGCQSAFLEFSDAIYRQSADGRHLYPSFGALWGPIKIQDSGLIQRITAEVRKHMDSGTLIYCPLAIGKHVDHVITRDCGRALQVHGSTVIFYKDFYYDGKWREEIERFLLRDFEVTLTPQEFDKKITAFSAYVSQISCLFGTRSKMVSYFGHNGRSELFFLPVTTSPSVLKSLPNVLRDADSF
jgi:LmbE family N-acetylglucosaminyl deacetylase